MMSKSLEHCNECLVIIKNGRSVIPIESNSLMIWLVIVISVQEQICSDELDKIY
jgi:hypothetical protein